MYACNEYDIVWMRLNTPSLSLYFCCFDAQAPATLFLFVTVFTIFFGQSLQSFSVHGRVYLVGDTNPRLGPVLEDRNLNRRFTSNANESPFLEVFGVL